MNEAGDELLDARGVPTSAQQELRDLLAHTRLVFGGAVIGMFAYGSLAVGDFDPSSSDLDVVVVLSGDLPNSLDQAVLGMYEELLRANSSWAQRIEVAFLPVDLLRTRVGSVARRHAFVNTSTQAHWIGSDVLLPEWVLNFHTAWAGDLALAGPSPRTLVAHVDQLAVRLATRDLLLRSWANIPKGATWMGPSKYQAFTVLTMCRALKALESGEMTSKTSAAAWAMKALDAQWSPLIRWALDHRSDPTKGDHAKALEFVHFAVEQARLPLAS